MGHNIFPLTNMTGSLLVATPSLVDPNFRRAILFLVHHSLDEGATGLIINRPLLQSVGKIAEQHISGPLYNAPLLCGGPVSQDQVIVGSFQWEDELDLINFETFQTGWDGKEIPAEWHWGLRVFLGHAGWKPQQLEVEIAQKSWFVVPPTKELIEMRHPEVAWRSILRSIDPMLKLIADIPDDLTLN